ncbi:MAG: hypothetical protein IKY37_05605 [Bacteroidaceae bacterium]|nr:hypothetical protein [Bacteroidaceae bacterium]
MNTLNLENWNEYLHEIGSIEQLTCEEEFKLAQRIHNGDNEALAKLTQANLRFVVELAAQYTTKESEGEQHICELKELTAVGNKALEQAATEYLSLTGLARFAMPFIRKAMEKKRLLFMASASGEKIEDILSIQRGNQDFLIYAVRETDDKLYYAPTCLYEYKGEPYKTITDALKVAVKDYMLRTGKTNTEIIEDFRPLYARQKHHQWLLKDNDQPIPGGGHCAHYFQTEIAGLYVRDNILNDKLRKINLILGEGFEITLVSNECYHKLLLNGDNNFLECYDKQLFSPLPGTRYFYRKSMI